MGRSSREQINERNKEELIKARAFFDAKEYIELMKSKSPESLESKVGILEINTVIGEKIFSNAKDELALDAEEMINYLHILKDEIENNL